MNHDSQFKVIRLRNLALQFERGQLDDEFAPAGMVPTPTFGAIVARRIRQLADAIEGGGR